MRAPLEVHLRRRALIKSSPLSTELTDMVRTETVQTWDLQIQPLLLCKCSSILTRALLNIIQGQQRVP